MANTIQEWNFQSGHVDDEILKNGGNYISGESVLLAAGPPFIDSSDFDWSQLYSIGVVQNFDLAQSRQIQQLFEIGSKQSYFIPGKTFVNASLSRVLVNGPSVLKAIYKINGDQRPSSESLRDNLPGNPYNPEGYNPDDEDAAVDSTFYPNLTSAFFNKPVGLLIMMQDSEGDNYGAVYLENCFVQAHQMSVQAQQTVLIESIQLRCQSVKPINIGAGV